MAAEKGCTPAQLALAWLLNRNADVIPIPGTSNPERLAENASAVNIKLGPEELDRIDRLAPSGLAAGARYDEAAMGLIEG
jgi:aryl-alcohol dehydrogenase-like predicted oxidoreductase